MPGNGAWDVLSKVVGWGRAGRRVSARFPPVSFGCVSHPGSHAQRVSLSFHFGEIKHIEEHIKRGELRSLAS